jgi:predicted molibdopterin-dependent oxidoreductase YjgC
MHYREAAANLLTNPVLDPYAAIPEFKVCAVHIEPVLREGKRFQQEKRSERAVAVGDD